MSQTAKPKPAKKSAPSVAAPAPTSRIQIFRAGRHVASSGQTVELSESDVAAIAAAYNPSVHEAPAVIGHPKADDPAYGWVKSLSADKGALEAELGELDPAFSEAVKTGSYKKVSASFYPPGSAANPLPAGYYLRHVGFLGAQPPAVKGLRPVELAEAADAIEIEIAFTEAEESAAATSSSSTPESEDEVPVREQAGPSPASASTEPGTEPANVPPPAASSEVDRRQAELDARERALAEREERLRAAEAQKVREAAADFAEGLVGQGRLLPREKGGLVELLLALPSAPLEFAESGKQVKVGPQEWLKGLLERMPVSVDYSERAAGAALPADDPQAIAQAAVELQDREAREGRTLSPAMAVRRVLGGVR